MDENTAMLRASNVYVTIPGFNADQPLVPDGISRIGIDIDARETTTGLDVEYRQYAPGQVRFSNLKVMLPAAVRATARDWFDDAASGINIRKNIIVELKGKVDGPVVMSATLYDCFPVSYDDGQALLEVNVDRIEIDTVASFRQNDGFDALELPVEATHLVVTTSAAGAFNNHAVQVSGGSQRIEITQTTVGDHRYATNSPGHKTIDPLTLRLVSSSLDLASWISDTIEGGSWTRQVEVSEVAGGPRRIFYDAFPTRITFLNPLLILDNGRAPAVLDITIKPIRLELK